MRERTREILKTANNKANGAKCYKNTFFSNFFRRKVRSFM